jgi:RES domain-containing protein
MRLWRISDYATLSGDGGLLAPGRWHSQGRRIVYLSDHPASALLELLVRFQIGINDIPDAYQLLAVDLPDPVSSAAIDPKELPRDWPGDSARTQSIGDRWLGDNGTALLKVPSAIVPFAFNWLLNPTYTDAAGAVIAEVIQTPLDARLRRS